MTTKPAPHIALGRIPVLDVGPVVDGGTWPARCGAGEVVTITATVFREGHDAVAATAVLVDPAGDEHSRIMMRPVGAGWDRFEAQVCPAHPGDWTFRVEGWDDPIATWRHQAQIKIAAGQDTELVFTEGADLLDEAARAWKAGTPQHEHIAGAATAMRDTSRPDAARLAAAFDDRVGTACAQRPLRRHVTPSATYILRVMRNLAACSAWYEVFPRSIGATRRADGAGWNSGTLRSTAAFVPYVAELGFDVLYLTPIHPIGAAHRKGPNNTLVAGEHDPGSPYAIGSASGGHEAIHPDLGTVADFEALCATAREHKLEVALDLALQCSPDHPWVSEHPEWFAHRADGSIAFAENPPKKYQDIYPLSFDTDPDGLAAEILRIVRLWIERGVTLFRVDNPHTKPVWFWEWLIATVRTDHPEVIFLAEAFTKPAMMRTLAKIGFHQSYTYFTWRHSATELRDYATQLSTSAHVITDGASGTFDYMRPNFWPTTPDILTPYMQHGGWRAHEIRAILAATLSPSWGIYGGYELCESVARPGAEEHIDSEKYEYKPRDLHGAYERGESLAPLLRALNTARRENPALRQLGTLRFHQTTHDQILAYSYHLPAQFSPTGEASTVLTVCSLDPLHVIDGEVIIEGHADRFGYHGFDVTDELTGAKYTWGARFYVRLGDDTSAHVARVIARH